LAFNLAVHWKNQQARQMIMTERTRNTQSATAAVLDDIEKVGWMYYRTTFEGGRRMTG
jgi:hypothetical protein